MNTENSIDSGCPFDWGLTSEHYSQFRDIYPQKLYEKLRKLGVGADNTSWLDLGTGTGILPQNMYNSACSITAVDISEEQISYAKSNADKNGWNINYFVSSAENTNLPSHTFDCITAAQCFDYFDRNIMKSEIKRLLKNGGLFVKVYMDWCLDDEIANKSISLVKKYNNKWNDRIGHMNIYDDIFNDRITDTFYSEIPFTRKSWHGRMCACRGTLASMKDDVFKAWSSDHIQMLMDYPECFTIKHKIYISYFKL